jgi:hypothetical protein
MVLAKETANTAASASTNNAPWVATNIGELVNATERRFSFKLNQPQTLSFSIPLTDPLADDLVTLTNDATSIPIIKLYRDTTLMMVAEVISAELASQGQVPTVAVVATETMWNRLTKRFIPDSKRSVGYRVPSTTDRTSDVMTQLEFINTTPAQVIPSTIETTFTETGVGSAPAGWALGTAFWTGGTSSLTKQTSGSWDTDSGSGFMRFNGTKDATTTQRTISARTSTGTSGIPVTPGTVYTARTRLRTITSVTGTNNGIYVQLAWYKTDGTASAVQATTVGTPVLTTNGTTTTLYDTGVAPSDAAYVAVFFIVTTNVNAQSFSYGLDNVVFGPAPQTGIAAGSATGFSSDTFAGGPWYYKPFMEFVQEAALTIGGFDFWQAPLDPVTNSGNSGTLTVDPYTTVDGVRRSFKGQARANAIFEYGTGRQNVTEYRFTLSGDGLINVAYALPPGFPSGGGVGTVSKADSTGTTRQRLREEVVSTDLQTNEARQAIANAHTSIRQRYKRVLTFTPQVEDGSRTPRFGLDYEIGDTVTARVKDQGSLLIDTTVRVYGADIEVDNQGMIRTNLTLVQEV